MDSTSSNLQKASSRSTGFTMTDAQKASMLKDIMSGKAKVPEILNPSQQKIREQLAELEKTRQKFNYLRKSWADKAVGIQSEVGSRLAIDLEKSGTQGTGIDIWRSINRQIVPLHVLAKPLHPKREFFGHHDAILENYLKEMLDAQNARTQAISSYRENKLKKMVLFRSRSIDQFMAINLTIINIWPDRKAIAKYMYKMIMGKNAELYRQHYELFLHLRKHEADNQKFINAAPIFL